MSDRVRGIRSRQGVRSRPAWVVVIAALVITFLAIWAAARVDGAAAGDDGDAPAIGAGPLKVNQPRAATSESTNCRLGPKLVPTCGVLQGALSAPVGDESPAKAFLDYEQKVGVRQRVVHYYHDAPQLFPTEWEMRLAREPGVPRTLMLNWKPENGLSWAQVAAGEGDAYVDAEAAYVRQNFTEPFFLSIHHEPENEVSEVPGSGFTAQDYAAMYRHVVDRFRLAGVTNAVFVMQFMGAQVYATKPWFAQLWPGDDYVDWIAFDPYQTPSLNGQTGGFPRMMDLHWGEEWAGAYTWSVTNHPTKPIMLAEWGLAEKPGEPSWKPWLLRSIPDELSKYPQLKAMLYFNKVLPEGDVRAWSTPASAKAFRKMAANPVFELQP
jgi:hypothetical protein